MRFISTTCGLDNKQKARGKGQKAKGKEQKAKGKGQRARGKKQWANMAFKPMPKFALCFLPFAFAPCLLPFIYTSRLKTCTARPFPLSPLSIVYR